MFAILVLDFDDHLSAIVILFVCLFIIIVIVSKPMD